MALWILFPRHLNRKANLARRKAGANSTDSWMGGRAYKFANGLAEINDLPFPNEPPLKKDSFKHHLLWSAGRLAGAGGFVMVDMARAKARAHVFNIWEWKWGKFCWRNYSFSLLNDNSYYLRFGCYQNSCSKLKKFNQCCQKKRLKRTFIAALLRRQIFLSEGPFCGRPIFMRSFQPQPTP